MFLKILVQLFENFSHFDHFFATRLFIVQPFECLTIIHAGENNEKPIAALSTLPRKLAFTYHYGLKKLLIFNCAALPSHTETVETGKCRPVVYLTCHRNHGFRNGIMYIWYRATLAPIHDLHTPKIIRVKVLFGIHKLRFVQL